MMTKTEQKTEAIREAWLCYFNRTLYEQGLITEDERNRMTRLIQSNTNTPRK